MKIKQGWRGGFWGVLVLFIFQTVITEGGAFAQEGKGSKGNESDLYTNVYVVPPTFLNEAALKPRKPTAKDVLESVGITFAPGSSVIYNASNSQLIVRNRKDQMDLVESYIDSIIDKFDTQIHVMVKFVESTDSINQAKSPQRNQPYSRAESGNSSERSSVDSERDMLKVLGADDIRAGIRDLTGPTIHRKKVAGVFTDPQFQSLIRKLRKKEGVRFLSEQDWMMRSGQRVIFRQGDQGMGITAVESVDMLTIDLKIFSREELEEDEGIRKVVLRDVTPLQDGRTIALERKLSNGRYRIEFITARILDPAGAPIRERVKNAGNNSAQKSEMVSLPRAIEKLKTDQIADVKEADAFALAGARLMADGDYEGSKENFIKSLRILPSHATTEPREKSYLEQLLRAIRK